MIEMDAKYKYVEKFEIDDLGDDCLMVYDQENENTHILNPVMSDIWKHCDGKNTVQEIINYIMEMYDIEDENRNLIREDCIQAITELLKNNLLVIVND